MPVAAVLALFAVGATPASAALPPSFGVEGGGAGQFRNPTGIAVTQSTSQVYLVDRGNNRVERFSSEGAFQLAFGWGVVNGSPELQVCGPAAPTPTATCRPGLAGSGLGQFKEAKGIAIDNDALSPSHGDLYVEDAGNHRAQKFGPSGQFILAFGSQGAGPGQFKALEPNAIATDSAGRVYLDDGERVQRFSPLGALEAEIALPGSGYAEGLAVDSAGDVYVSKQGTNFHVHKYDSGGVELGSPRDEAGSAAAISLGPSAGPAERLLVGNQNGGGPTHLLAYEPAGAEAAAFDAGSGRNYGGGVAYGESTNAVYALSNVAPHIEVRIVPVPPPGPLPLAGSEAASELEPTAAALNATLNPEGAETTYRFLYGETESYGEETPDQSLPGDFEDHAVKPEIEGLQPATTYHFRLIAESECEPLAHPGHICVSEGEDAGFTTAPPVSIDSASASGVSATAATLETELNPHGLPTSFHFEYDTSPYAEGEEPHGTATPEASAGEGEGDVVRTAQIQGLAPDTTYHYRVVAHNSLGATEGPDRSFTTEGASSSLLPDSRAWELVSPPDKHGSPLEAIAAEGGLIQAAADGSRITYIARGPTDTEPAGNRGGSGTTQQLLSSRAPAGGWSTLEIATAHKAAAGVQPGNPSEYKAFSTDLGLGAVEPFGATPLSPLASEKTPYLRIPDGEYTPLVSEANVPAGTEFGGHELEPGSEKFGGGVGFVTASPDLRHLVLESPVSLVAGFQTFGEPSLYEWTEGRLEPLSVLPGGVPSGEEGTAYLGNEGVAGHGQMRNAISPDGARAVFGINARPPHLYLRDLAREETIQLDVLQPGAEGGVGKAVFQTASVDDSRVFFTDAARLTADSTATGGAPDLYMCEVTEVAGHLACALSDLTVDHNPGEAADVQGAVIGADESGRRLYLAATGALGEGAAVNGACPGGEAGGCVNLYALDTETGQRRLVAILAKGTDKYDWFGGQGGINLGEVTSRVSPDGRFLAFMSSRPLTGYDNRDAKSGARDQEVYEYDYQADRLICASCDPSGARPRGTFDSGVFPGLLVDRRALWEGQTIAGSVPGWTLVDTGHALYQSRYLSSSGRLFFDAADALVPADTNGAEDVYEYEPAGVGDCTTSTAGYSPTSGGCVALISSGASSEESAFMDASESGEDVFFLTSSRLAPKDVDGALDLYDARVGGGEAEAAKPVQCSGDSCQAPPAPPAEAGGGSLSFHGPGTPRGTAPRRCAKGKARRHGRCVARRHRHKKKRHRRHHRKVRHAKPRGARR